MRSPRAWLGAALRGVPSAMRYLAGDVLAGVVAALVVGLVALVLALSAVGMGLLLWGATAALVRQWCDRERRRTAGFHGRPISSPYLPGARGRRSTAPGGVDVGALWLDLGALCWRIAVGIPLGLVAIVLPLVSLNAAVIPVYWWALPESDPTGSLFAVTSWWDAAGSALLGLVGLAAWLAATRLAPTDAAVAARLLSPRRTQELLRRAAIEADRRRSAVSAHTAELQRIERDLHDAAQNRLVAVSMFVGTARRQVATGSGDPGPALDQAQRAASDALAEVRRIIHGIYPPVLTEEGLVPALGDLVDRASIPTRLHVDGPGTTPAAVDAALYFAVAEALANVAKHSQATECDVRLRWGHDGDDAWVTATVIDDGVGGADPGRGSGLVGVEHRVRALGGRMELSSPPGGPTEVTIGLPCES